MIFVNLDDPVGDMWDTGCVQPGFSFLPGAEVRLDGSPLVWTVVMQVRDVVLVRDTNPF